MRTITTFAAPKLLLGEMHASSNRKKDFNRDEFIYIPTLNLYFSKEIKHFNKNWFETHKILQDNEEFMPTLTQFIEFLKYIRNNVSEIYNKITNNQFRAEWIDLYFKTKYTSLYVNYCHQFNKKGSIIPGRSEALDRETLMEGAHIWLDDWIDSNHTSQGLPNKKVDSYESPEYSGYISPRKDKESVVQFFTYFGKTNIICDGYPLDRRFDLGVRAVRKKV